MRISSRGTLSLWQAASISLALFTSSCLAAGNATACTSLKTTDFSSLNTTILNATYYDSPVTVSTPGVCFPSATVNVSLCRVQFVVNTSSISAITAEAWLPNEWNERLMALGNGGLNGCIDYSNLNYGSLLGFAAVASNNGHDGGDTGVYFANNTEVLADFTSRSIHTETIVGKAFVKAYYGQAQNRSYYVACSTGGRQGFYSALHYPEDFDGILAGSPATNFNHLMGWSAMLSRYIGAPAGKSSPSFITSDQWDLVSAEIMKQCDALDGVTDGIITEPDDCIFRPEELLCDSKSNSTGSCLSVAQVEALRLIYSPVYGNNNTLLYPRFEPGAEKGTFNFSRVFNGDAFSTTDSWMRYVVDGVNFDYSTFGIDDIYAMDALDPQNVSTYNGDLSAFRNRGGKLISYHGRADPAISALNSKDYYDMTARTLGESRLDDFYRLFLIPGMGHCGGGTGAVNFGLANDAASQVNTSSTPPNGTVSSRNVHKRATESNIILDLVNWVENGTAPDTIVGVSSDGSTYRTHCRYPWRSVWDGSEWTCVDPSA